MSWKMSIGAQIRDNSTHFRVWAPHVQHAEVVLYEGHHIVAAHEMLSEQDGYFSLQLGGVRAGAHYKYRLDHGGPYPDPASRSQPQGVHGPSEVINPGFNWTDSNWHGIALEDLVLYELHIGTVTAQGTFESLIERLEDIKSLGITAIELMPVADFPGKRNWGYDGVCQFAPAHAYGGPQGLKKLVDAAHHVGLAVFLDVVYNHLGPDGNYLRAFSQDYFTDRHKTPWGDALNFDDLNSGPVRNFFVENACYWINEYHIDGLRFDAISKIEDDSPTHILAEISTQVHASIPAERKVLLIAESEHNDPMLMSACESGGWGLDGMWADDFHHQMHVLLTDENDGYYQHYNADIQELALTLRQGWWRDLRKEPNVSKRASVCKATIDDIHPSAFIHCLQNHDQVGNRAVGDRLTDTISLEAYRAASMLFLLSPYTPLLWMGQEWAATPPFIFFTDHHHELGRLVTQGRRSEFGHFSAFSKDDLQIPDPQEEMSFLRSKLRWDEREATPHAGIWQLYHDLLHMRRELPALRERSRKSYSIHPLHENGLAMLRHAGGKGQTLLLVTHFGKEQMTVQLGRHKDLHAPEGSVWQIRLDSEDPRYEGKAPTTLTGNSVEFSGPGAVLLEAVKG